jgi:hypothetical protein
MAMAATKRWTVEQTSKDKNVFDINFDFTRNHDWEQWVLLRADVHHDNPKCDQDLEKEHLDQAVEYDAPVIDDGDLFCVMGGKWDKRSSKESIRPEHQVNNYLDALVDTATEFYEPYKDVLTILGRGNHETAIIKAHETDLTDRLAASLRRCGGNVFASGYGGWIRFRFYDRRCKSGENTPWATIGMKHYHGTGGGGPVTRGVIQTNRNAVIYPDADIVLTGHTHDDWAVGIPRERLSTSGAIYRDTQLHVRPPGYKDAWGDGSGGWEVERGLGPKSLGSVWLRFFYSRSRNKILYDTQKAQ